MSRKKYTEVSTHWVKENKNLLKRKRNFLQGHMSMIAISDVYHQLTELSQSFNLNHLVDLKVDIGTIFLLLLTIPRAAFTSSSLVIKSTAAANTL